MMRTEVLISIIKPYQLKCELVLFAITGTGLLLSFIQNATVGPITIVNLSVFSFFYAFLAQENRESESRTLQILHKATYFGFAVGTMGILFKVQNWPGARMMLQIGIALILIRALHIAFSKLQLYSVADRSFSELRGCFQDLGMNFCYLFLQEKVE